MNTIDHPVQHPAQPQPTLTLSPSDPSLNPRDIAFWQTGHEYSEKELVELISHNDDFVCACLKAVYNRQTKPEQQVSRTIHRNGIGFTASDATELSGYAEHLNSTGFLTPEQIRSCRRPTKTGQPFLAKYRKQILRLLNGPKLPRESVQ
jgi:hypothetical protein